MIRVRTGSRLHFGFLHLPHAEEQSWPGRGGALPARNFGGVGLMIEQPAVQIRFEPGDHWAAQGPTGDRALQFAGQVAQKVPGLPPGLITIEECPPQHVGLGVGTQLGLAVARAITAQREGVSAKDLAQLVERGRRSAIGVHGFEQGGFLVEGGKRRADDLAPLLVRPEFPADWRILVVLPPWGRGLAGPQEKEALRLLQATRQPLADTDALCRIVLLGILPALAERDLATFGEALYDFNRRVGEAFAPVQGGIYAHPLSADVVATCRQEGVAGVAQSSWGPGICAVDDDAARLAFLAKRLTERFGFGPGAVVVTEVRRQGAVRFS